MTAMRISIANFLHFMIRLADSIAKTRNMERATQALAPREHENYRLFFRVFPAVAGCFRDKFFLFGFPPSADPR